MAAAALETGRREMGVDGDVTARPGAEFRRVSQVSQGPKARSSRVAVSQAWTGATRAQRCVRSIIAVELVRGPWACTSWAGKERTPSFAAGF